MATNDITANLPNVLASIDRARAALDAQSDQAGAMLENGEITPEILDYVDGITAFQRGLIDMQAVVPTWLHQWADKVSPIDPAFVLRVSRLHTLLVDLAAFMDRSDG